MILTTSETIPGREITEILGVVTGNSVRARHLGRDVTAALKNLVGGEIREYGVLQAESREQAARRMEERAGELGADAVIGMRYSTSMIMSGASEVLAYGTAVRLSSSA